MTNSSDNLTDRYEQLLAEARAIKGVSLGKDAWRRLRKSRVAMASLWLLVLLSLLAFFTPLLPLQAPRKVDTDRAFLPPTLSAARIEGDKIKEHFGIENPFAADAAAAASAPPGAGDGGDEADSWGGAILYWLVGFWAQWISRLIEALNWYLVQARLAIFGEWAIPSLCGTDELGRDLLARLFWGARVSIIVGLVATLVSLVIGVSYGAISGYVGGRVDNIMMRAVDVMYSIPFIFVVIFIITILSEPDHIKPWLERHGIDRITIFFFVVGAIYWLTMARVVRGQVISLKNDQFVEAARTIGAGRGRIIFLHIVPNLLSVVIVYLTLTIPRVMLFEAFLSFLGLGVQAPDVSWGLLANAGFKVITPLEIYWWLILFPGIALALTLFALNFLGDGLRDALDPRMKNR